MKKIIVIIISSFLGSSSYGLEVAPSIWAIRADKFGVGGRSVIKFDKKLSRNEQPFFEGWTGSFKVKKNIFKLNASEIVKGVQQVNLKQYFENYKVNNKISDKNALITVKDFNFIKLIPEDLSLVIDIDDFKENVMVSKWNGENVYIEIPQPISNSSFELSYNNLFGAPSLKEELKGQLKKLPGFEEFIKDIQLCIMKKDKDCITDKVALDNKVAEKALIKEKISSNFTRRFILDDPKTCEIYKRTRIVGEEFDNHIPKNIEKDIDYSKSKLWSSLQEAFEYNLESTFVNLESLKYENGVSTVLFFRKVSSTLNCSNHVDLRIEINKSKYGWSINTLELTSFDDDYM